MTRQSTALTKTCTCHKENQGLCPAHTAKQLIIATTTTTKERHRNSPSQTGEGAFEEPKGHVAERNGECGTQWMGQCRRGEGGWWGGADPTACSAEWRGSILDLKNDLTPPFYPCQLCLILFLLPVMKTSNHRVFPRALRAAD